MASGKRKGKRQKPSPAAAAVAGADDPSPSRPSRGPTRSPSPPASGAPRRRFAWVGLAAIYLATVWLDGVGSTLPAKLMPRAWVYFAQIAALFKFAGQKSIDYRAEGWLCSEKKWIEIDVDPFFPLERGNKENRFYRAVQFYRRDRKVMRALDEYVVARHNAHDAQPIGGVRFSSLRIPYPRLGTKVERYTRRPLAAYPDDQRHAWYWTPGSKRRERCHDAGSAIPPPMPEDRDDDHEPRDKDKDKDKEVEP